MAKGTPTKIKRNKALVRFRRAGMSFRKIGRVFGISAARAQQLYKRETEKRKGT